MRLVAALFLALVLLSSEAFAVIVYAPCPWTPEMQKDADSGDLESQNALGEAYEAGEGVKQDFVKAMEWFRKAADRGYSKAQWNIALQDEVGANVKKDIAEAYFWYSVEERGKEKQEYAYRVGALLTPEQRAAVEKRVAEWKPKPFTGDPLAENDKKRFAAWEEKARTGDAKAQYNLGLLYRNGIGVKKDNTDAMAWYRKAADNGDAQAQFFLGKSYAGYRDGFRQDGDPEQDWAEAVKWYRKAAEQGNSAAQYGLGDLYSTHLDTIQDWAEAYFWYSVSSLSIPHAQSMLAKVVVYHLTAEQKVAADKRVAEWCRAHGSAPPPPAPGPFQGPFASSFAEFKAKLEGASQ